MNITARAIVLVLAIMFLAACSSSTPQPTVVPSPTQAPTATSTQLPSPSPFPNPTITATNTPVPTTTPEPSATPESAALPMPHGTPQAGWEGIPVMPGAVAGEGDKESYFFIVQSSVEEVQEYYQTALVNLGWNLFAAGEGETQNVMLIFMNGTSTLSIAIIDPGQEDGIVQVMLVK